MASNPTKRSPESDEVNLPVIAFKDDYLKLDTSLLPDDALILANCRLCISGSLTPPRSALIISQSTGKILEVLTRKPVNASSSDKVIDLNNAILAPGFLELQTNGMRGFHFTHFEGEESYGKKVEEVARYLPSQGVTGFWGTIPTVAANELQKILPSLSPREISNGASLLGAHAEGPYLHPSKKGAHNSSLFHDPSTTPPSEVYGEDMAKDNHTLKLVTLAPELSGSTSLTTALVQKGIRVTLGHSSASYDDGLAAVRAGATCLTHTLNAMAPLHHRDPGLAGLVTAAPSTMHSPPYFSIITDGNHLHPSVASMLFRANPEKCIIITDSIELAGLPDGTYPGHSQISSNQTKIGSRVVIEGTETLIGGCATLVECVRNLMQWSGCNVAEAVRCVTENIAELMGEKERGKIEEGRRADLVVLDDEANVLETWVAGRKVWEQEGRRGEKGGWKPS